MEFTMTPINVILSVWLLVLTALCAFMYFKLFRLTRGTHGANLEQHIASINKHFATYTEDRAAFTNQLAELGTRVSTSVRGIRTIRFNAFPGAGTGSQSFATAFVNELGDGTIISTLVARERVGVYAKEVHNFKPQQDVTDEEAQALAEAVKSLHTHAHA